MSTPHVSQNYVFPIPALTVQLGAADERPWLGPFEAVVDTGADTTAMPLALLRQVRAHSIGQGRLRGPWGEIHDAVFYLIELQVEGLHLPGVQVAGEKAITEIILGRNVLNKLPLFVDGPTQHSEVLDDATVRRLRARRKTQP